MARIAFARGDVWRTCCVRKRRGEGVASNLTGRRRHVARNATTRARKEEGGEREREMKSPNGFSRKVEIEECRFDSRLEGDSTSIFARDDRVTYARTCFCLSDVAAVILI